MPFSVGRTAGYLGLGSNLNIGSFTLMLLEKPTKIIQSYTFLFFQMILKLINQHD